MAPCSPVSFAWKNILHFRKVISMGSRQRFGMARLFGFLVNLGCLRRVMVEWFLLNSLGKLHYTTLNYALDYTLYHKLSDCALFTLNYHTLHCRHRILYPLWLRSQFPNDVKIKRKCWICALELWETTSPNPRFWRWVKPKGDRA